MPEPMEEGAAARAIRFLREWDVMNSPGFSDGPFMQSQVDIIESTLTALLAELTRQAAVVEAAREFVHKTDSADSEGWIRFDARLRRAVDLYDRAALDTP